MKVNDVITDLKYNSGLTTKQLGRLFNVSSRTIHSWVAGNQIPPKHNPRIHELHKLIYSLNANTPEERKALMLSSQSGNSLFHEFLKHAPQHQQIHFSNFKQYFSND